MAASTIDTIIQNAVHRILSVVSPKQIFLFGSAVHGQLHDNSDIDLLVVVPNGLHRRKTAQTIYRNMIGLGFATDIVVVTEDDVETYRHTNGYVIQHALREGKIIHAA